MHVTYRPEDGEEQRWEFVPGRVRQSAAELVEKRFGKNWDIFCAGVQSGDSKARRVLLWHLLRQEHHTLRLEDVPDFFMDELVVEHSVDELHTLRDRLMKTDMPEDEREQMLVALDLEISEAIARGEQHEGKAPSSSAA